MPGLMVKKSAANDREKASEAGKKGGQNSHGGGRKSE
jgi:general stress protein YciG